MIYRLGRTTNRAAGRYQVIFNVGDYLSATAGTTSTPTFLDLIPFRFTIADAAQHYHLPLKFTPWGFSLVSGQLMTKRVVLGMLTPPRIRFLSR